MLYLFNAVCLGGIEYGGMSERFKEPVLKTGDSFTRAVSSNLTPSAITTF